MISILALDPGKTTGFCYGAYAGDNLIIDPGEEVLTAGGLDAFIQSFISSGVPKYIIYEDFQFRQGVRTGLDLTPAKLIGILELWKERDCGAYFYVQQPSVQGDKAFFNNERLKELGAYWAHGKGHARSATKHLLYWCKFGPGGQYIPQGTTIEMLD